MRTSDAVRTASVFMAVAVLAAGCRTVRPKAQVAASNGGAVVAVAFNPKPVSPPPPPTGGWVFVQERLPDGTVRETAKHPQPIVDSWRHVSKMGGRKWWNPLNPLGLVLDTGRAILATTYHGAVKPAAENPGVTAGGALVYVALAAGVEDLDWFNLFHDEGGSSRPTPRAVPEGAESSLTVSEVEGLDFDGPPMQHVLIERSRNVDVQFNEPEPMQGVR